MADCASGGERTDLLKDMWRHLTGLMDREEWEPCQALVRKMVEEEEDVSVLRMALDSTQPWADREEASEMRRSLIGKIEGKIGKIY